MNIKLVTLALIGCTSLAAFPVNASVLDKSCKVRDLPDSKATTGENRHPIQDWLEQTRNPSSSHPLAQMTMDELLDELIACEDANARTKRHARPARTETGVATDI